MPSACASEDRAIRKRLQCVGSALLEAVDTLYVEVADAAEVASTHEEMQRLIQSDDVDTLRALCLQGVYLDADVVRKEADGCRASLDMVDSFRKHTLPLTFPLHLDRMCQHPQEFVRANVVLQQMWGANDIRRMFLPPETEEDPLAVDAATA